MFSRLLKWARDHHPILKWLLFGWLAALVAANIFILPHHPHFALEKFPGFWAIFGAGCGLAFVVILKKIIFLMISRPEDFYESK
ncbi:MAG: hypothetical protein COX19_17575 [Desulfobacterales bacterium CG23_combo_of_CG06-09_8_20_14_all_51_8]|nr:MAG: hypothetical protein COX19_17575 [Desulfobacterales bacterium CG23_combo_of_CG06-09_8_20_14_all_51_8]